MISGIVANRHATVTLTFLLPNGSTLQSSISGYFIAAGVIGSIAIGLAIAGRSKQQGEDKQKS